MVATTFQLLPPHRLGVMGRSSQSSSSLLCISLIVISTLLYASIKPSSAFDVLAPDRLNVPEVPGSEAKRARYYTDPYYANHKLEFIEFCEKQKVLRAKPDLIKGNGAIK